MWKNGWLCHVLECRRNKIANDIKMKEKGNALGKRVDEMATNTAAQGKEHQDEYLLS